MGRYTGPACRLCRREGMKLFLKGTRCSMAKCPIETGRPAPGMHGMTHRKKVSDYGIQLREKQKLKRQFNLQEGQFRVIFHRALQTRGVTGLKMLQLLETRLDNVIFRLGLAASRRAARQLVTHSHVTVNGRSANIPSMVLPEGAVVAVKSRAKSRDLAKRSLESMEGRDLPPWLSLDVEKLTGKVERIPTREEIAPIVSEQLIVELYSK